MQATEIMISPVLCTPTTTARQVAHMMKQFDVGVILIVENLINRKLVGMITDRDLILRLPHDRAPDQMMVQECMTQGDLLCCKPDNDINEDSQLRLKMEMWD
jgi:CBS domain-containing protein